MLSIWSFSFEGTRSWFEWSKRLLSVLERHGKWSYRWHRDRVCYFPDKCRQDGNKIGELSIIAVLAFSNIECCERRRAIASRISTSSVKGIYIKLYSCACYSTIRDWCCRHSFYSKLVHSVHQFFPLTTSSTFCILFVVSEQMSNALKVPIYLVNSFRRAHAFHWEYVRVSYIDSDCKWCILLGDGGRDHPRWHS